MNIKAITKISFLLIIPLILISCGTTDSLSGNKNSKMGDDGEMMEMMRNRERMEMDMMRDRERMEMEMGRDRERMEMERRNFGIS